MNEAEGRAAVDRIAREWIGTPFQDCACIKGVGCDCAMFLKGVYSEAGVIDNFSLGPYSPQHFLHSTRERFMEIVLRFSHEVSPKQAKPADVVLYKIAKAFAHGAIIVQPGWPHIIHAHYAARRVCRALGTSVHLGPPILDVKFFSFW